MTGKQAFIKMMEETRGSSTENEVITLEEFGRRYIEAIKSLDLGEGQFYEEVLLMRERDILKSKHKKR